MILFLDPHQNSFQLKPCSFDNAHAHNSHNLITYQHDAAKTYYHFHAFFLSFIFVKLLARARNLIQLENPLDFPHLSQNTQHLNPPFVISFK